MIHKKMTFQKLVVPVALLVWVVVMVAGLSYSPPEPEYGEVTGVVIPGNVPSYVYIINDGVIIASAQTNTENGEFFVANLSEGEYTVEVRSTSVDYAALEITGVEIKTNEITDLGTLTLKPNTSE